MTETCIGLNSGDEESSVRVDWGRIQWYEDFTDIEQSDGVNFSVAVDGDDSERMRGKYVAATRDRGEGHDDTKPGNPRLMPSH